ncbi:cell surface protein [Chryseobacterium arthrosphaerae]|uniref:cell surface protein n=1 Tax=Chryseobacterium arthrosphaerae TaxID=651561 RepID=UPI001F4A33D1|nr:cell surface protein [Chryseobacterium arthrosphaerae]MDG4651748.1 cell surface protein [Chryseobacterium arthrosphaerae]
MRRNTFTYLKIGFLSCILAGVTACKHNDEDEFTFSGLDDSYSIERLKVLTIPTNASGSVTWSINDSVISQSSALEFISPKANAYPLTLKINNKGNEQVYHSKIVVTKEKVPYSKYIAKVLDFRPAVGQFMNEIPEYAPGNTAANMLQKANESLVGGNSTMISLGGYGGYVVFGFDHTVPNLNGRDFKVLGNAFFGNDASDPRSGSCEPGIIMVAYDRNKNGKPDNDEWYEIAGSEYFKNTTVKNYSITYYKPDENKPPVPGSEFWQTDVEYIKWTDNLGNKGFKTKNTFHAQSYYPLWFADPSYGFSGTRLANNFYDQNGDGSYWVGKSYEFGYADNAPNNDEASNIDISWAVDSSGRYVKLPGIDFMKIYTGVNQEAGWLGEVSTEVAGAYDLHLK